MGTGEKRDKHKKRRFVSPEEKLERELKDCMHCRFFWGHNNRCANGTCCKPSKKKEQKLPTECVGCPYYQGKVYNSIREFGYNLKTTPIVFVGGGAVVMKNFGSHDAKNISYNLDVKANARGYEQLATMGLKSTKRLS